MIDDKIIKSFEEKYKSEKNSELLENTVSTNRPSSVFKNRDIYQEYNFVFSNKIKGKTDISDQKSSGRCWLFAFTNLLRYKLINKYNLEKSFYLSNTHLFFYHKLESSFLFLKNIEETKDLDITDRLVQHLLDDPVCDGGTWNCLENIVKKYGMVPLNNKKNSYHSENTKYMNFYLKHNLIRFANIIRTRDDYDINNMLYTIYKLLCYFLGKPVKRFNWSYYKKGSQSGGNSHHGKDEEHNIEDDSDESAITVYDLTPLTFYKKYCKFNFDDYVICSNIPIEKYPFYKIYNVNYCQNMYGGLPTRFFNIPITLMNKLCQKSIDADEPIWFGADVGKYLDTKRGIGDTLLYNYDALYAPDVPEMTKGEKVSYGHSSATHAMLIIGYNKKNKKVDKWQVENSWGKVSIGGGYIRINDEWFNKYCYLTAIPKKLFSKKATKLLKSSPITVEAWSEFPCAALN